MFSGIVEEAGKVMAIEKTGSGCRFTVEANKVTEDVKLGDSIANNGCCLTVVEYDDSKLSFDLLEETQRATNLKMLQEGSLINLERSLRVGERIGGHFVTGHVDGTGEITRWEKSGSDYVLEIKVAKSAQRYLVSKGSIAIDGISLTLGEVNDAEYLFNVWIIPHTYEVTTLKERKVGDVVNLEFDMLAKYVEKLTKFGG
ncbi:MAG: riboflavin synthase [Verrucomicrobiota bacterium]